MPGMRFSRSFNRRYNRIIKPYLAGKKRKRSFAAIKRRKSNYRAKRKNKRRMSAPRTTGSIWGMGHLGTTAHNFIKDKKKIVSYYEQGFRITAPTLEVPNQPIILRLRDWYDPLASIGGENTVDRDFWARFYNFYRVYACRYVVDFENASGATIGQRVGLFITRVNDNPNSSPRTSEAVSYPGTQSAWQRKLSDRSAIVKEKHIYGYSRNSTHPRTRIAGSVNLDKLERIGPSKHIQQTAGSFTAKVDPFVGEISSLTPSEMHPEKSNYMVIYTREANVAPEETASAIIVKVRLWMYIELFERTLSFQFQDTEGATVEIPVFEPPADDYADGDTPTP